MTLSLAAELGHVPLPKSYQIIHSIFLTKTQTLDHLGLNASEKQFYTTQAKIAAINWITADTNSDPKPHILCSYDDVGMKCLHNTPTAHSSSKKGTL